MKKTLIASVLTLGMVFSVQAKDIVDTAVAAGSFKTLAAALGAAGLVDTLKSKGPFTVFAPTDEAFAKIPKADLDALLAPLNVLTAAAPTPEEAARRWGRSGGRARFKKKQASKKFQSSLNRYGKLLN